MEYGPYFLDESGYVISISTKPRELWNFSETSIQNNDFYEITISTNGFIPIAYMVISYKTLEELFYKSMSLISGSTTVFGLTLPRYSLSEITTVMFYREPSSVLISITNTNIIGDKSEVSIILTPNDAATFINGLMKVYLEGSGLK